jgi:hypothetical protein
MIDKINFRLTKMEETLEQREEANEKLRDELAALKAQPQGKESIGATTRTSKALKEE